MQSSTFSLDPSVPFQEYAHRYLWLKQETCEAKKYNARQRAESNIVV